MKYAKGDVASRITDLTPGDLLPKRRVADNPYWQAAIRRHKEMAIRAAEERTRQRLRASMPRGQRRSKRKPVRGVTRSMTANLLWQAAQIRRSRLDRMPPPSSPAWVARHLFEEAQKEHQVAARALQIAKRAARDKTRPVGLEQGRANLRKGEALFDELSAWLKDYEALKETVYETTAARLPELGLTALNTESWATWRTWVHRPDVLGE